MLHVVLYALHYLLFRSTQVLAIDEVSMVAAYMLDLTNAVLQSVRVSLTLFFVVHLSLLL